MQAQKAKAPDGEVKVKEELTMNGNDLGTPHKAAVG